MSIPNITLNNGMKVPAIGFGTCKHSLDKPIDQIILNAMEVGYRYFDTASFYETERDLGKAVRQSGLERKDLCIATKLWYEELGYENAKKACYSSLERLGLDYLDIYLIHWPKAPGDDNWKSTLLDTWRALNELKEEGVVKALGVSNFLPHHLELLAQLPYDKPVVDQLEMHLGYFQEYVYRYLSDHNIQCQAWSPIGRGREGFNVNKNLNEIAQKYGVSVQKLSLRYLIQRNIMPLPWTTNAEHMKSNLDVFDFEIADEDMSMLSCMPQETWLGEHPDFYLPVTKHLNVEQ